MKLTRNGADAIMIGFTAPPDTQPAPIGIAPAPPIMVGFHTNDGTPVVVVKPGPQSPASQIPPIIPTTVPVNSGVAPVPAQPQTSPADVSALQDQINQLNAAAGDQIGKLQDKVDQLAQQNADLLDQMKRQAAHHGAIIQWLIDEWKKLAAVVIHRPNTDGSSGGPGPASQQTVNGYARRR